MVNMLIKSLNGMHLNQDHGYQYHIFFEQNTESLWSSYIAKIFSHMMLKGQFYEFLKRAP